MPIELFGKSTWTTSQSYFEANAVEGEMVTDKAPAAGPAAPFSLSLKFMNHGINYRVLVKKSPELVGWVIGTWTGDPVSRDVPAIHGHCQARLYRCKDGSVVLLGKWTEDATMYEWFASFSSST